MSSRPLFTCLLVLSLLCAAALLRILPAVQPGLWVDEIFSLAMATGHSLEHPAAEAMSSLGDYAELEQAEAPSTLRRYMRHETPPAGAGRVIRAVSLSDTSPPLYYLLLNLWTRATGTSDAALRLFSTLWALACLPLLWVVGRTIGGNVTAWIACVLFAFSPPAIYYSAEGRMYALLWFLALSVAWLSFDLARRGARPHLFICWALAAAAGLLTHYFFAFVLTACVSWLWLNPGKLSRVQLAAAATLIALLVLPWYVQLPDSLSRWRVTAGWLDYPLTWKQALTAPFVLAWSLLSGTGVWGGSKPTDALAAGLYAVLIVATVRQGVGRLVLTPVQLLWFWVLGACAGPLVFDLLRSTNTSLVARYALPGLPAGLLLAAVAIGWLPRKARVMFLSLIVLTWLPGIRGIVAEPSRPWQPFPDIAARLAASVNPSDLIVVHSIPSGVLGVSRYLETDIPLFSWVIRLDQRRIPDDMSRLVADRCKVALVKVHDLGEPSPAEAWLREHATLDLQDRWSKSSSQILYFIPKSGNNRSAPACPD